MIADFEALACKAKENIAGLFQILGDAGTTERSHLIELQQQPETPRKQNHPYPASTKKASNQG